MITLILQLALIGVIVYFIQKLPIDDTFKWLIRVVIILAVVIYLVRLFGVDLPLPRFR